MPLDDHHLAGIGLAAVYESSAKGIAGAALRALCSLDFEAWKKLEREKFANIVYRIGRRVADLNDAELSDRFKSLQSALDEGHEIRHIVVHVVWGEGGAGFLGYDYMRSREVAEADITEAVDRCAELKRASHWFGMRVAELIKLGILQEREAGPGLSVLTKYGSARL